LRKRTTRRAAQRELTKLEDAREKLARISPGGAPERPIDVESASTVERRALALGCARCEGETRVEAHDAVAGLRRVRARCKACGAVREVWLRIESRMLS
jgi:hypothetical protein